MEIMKMAIIHEYGKLDYIMDDSINDHPHIILMLDYIKNHYPNDEYLKQCNNYTAINTIAMYLASIGEIVFLNTTTYREEALSKYGKSGIMLMPNKLHEEQIYDLFKLKDKLEELRELQIWHSIKKDGSAQMKIGDANIISDYLKTKRFVKKRK